MIIKSYEINKINIKKTPYILLYGKNEGLKKETTDNLLKDKNNILNYEEKEILDNSSLFLENILSKSLFETEKIIIIKRSTDKIFKIINEILDKKLDDLIFIFNADNLEKKSKLRSFFEKDKKCICVPFYPDNEQTLSRMALNFIKQKSISLSQSNLNLIVNRCNGDRETLLNELNKIEFLNKSRKKITLEDIEKLTNLVENHSISDLVDNCLAKNTNKILRILNENNFNTEDSIIILRTFLNKSKKILLLSNEFKKNKDIDLTILNARPPIFWKDKEITKKQILLWSPDKIKEVIYKINEIELIIKKNLNNSINVITDFILEQSKKVTNS
tara:strand:- start:5 stop:997 length:993 start_codon:yes stop_codon:yes gene_type:complete